MSERARNIKFIEVQIIIKFTTYSYATTSIIFRSISKESKNELWMRLVKSKFFHLSENFISTFLEYQNAYQK